MTTPRSNPIPLFALVLAAACLPAQAQVPSEVTTLTWCVGPAKDCLQWSASAGATEYRLYRGELASLACLPNSAWESCLESVFTGATTGPGAITENPPPGRFYWYLLTAANAQAEGTSGTERLNGVSQPRVRNSTGTCPVTCSPAGGGCSAASDCCSSACSAGCQEACCVSPGGTCTDYSDCCSGNCNGGTCQTCFALGQACIASAQCCSGGCTGGQCGVACGENGGACTGNAQCCSGNCSSGTCQAPPPYDGVATPVPDLPHVASATIGAAGGSIQAGGMTLTIPPNALDDDTLITMTPLLDLADSPLAGTLIGGAVLEPSGLSFRGSATLTIPRPQGVALLDVLGFGSETDGSELHLVSPSVSGSTIQLQLGHFSTAGASSAGGAGAAAMQMFTPSSAESAALNRIEIGCRDCYAEIAADLFGRPGCTHCESERVAALREWYTKTPGGVRSRLVAAIGATLDEVVSAGREWFQWVGSVNGAGTGIDVSSSLNTELTEAYDKVKQAFQNVAERTLHECTGNALLFELQKIVLVAAEADHGGLSLDPDAHSMPFLCAHLVYLAPPTFPAVAAVGPYNTLAGQVMLDVYEGPDRVPPIPLEATIIADQTDETPFIVPVASDGSFSAVLSPMPPNSTFAFVSVRVRGSGGLFENSQFEVYTSFTRPMRPRFLVAVRNSGGTAFYDEYTLLLDQLGDVRSRLAGDGLAGATVTYELNGIGSLSPTSVVTDVNGRPPDVIYTPPQNTSGDATITSTVLGESGTATFHVHGLPTITSVGPSPLFGPPSEFPGLVFTGTVVIHGTNLQGGEIFTDGPILMLGTSTVDPTGTVIQKNYSIAEGAPNVPFHFFVSTPVGTVQVDDTISTSTAGGPPLTSISPSPVMFRCGVGQPPHTGTIVIQGSNLQGGEIVAAHSPDSDLRFFQLLGPSTVNGAGTTIQRSYRAGLGGPYVQPRPMSFLVVTPQGMSVITGERQMEDIFGTCTGTQSLCHASFAGDHVYEVQGGGFDDAEIVNNDGTLIFTSEPRIGTRATCLGMGVQTIQQDYILSSGATVGQHFNTYIVGPSGWICLVDEVIAGAPDFCHCGFVPQPGGEGPLQCSGPPLPWP